MTALAATSEQIALQDWSDDHAPTWRPLVHEPAVSPDEFKAAFRNHPAGVAVITADPGDGPVALTATSVFSVSAEPPLLVFSLSSGSSATPGILRSSTVVVHLLGVDQIEIAKTCATSGIDRFADKSLWHHLSTGEPCFHSADVWIRARIVQRMNTGGSHVLAVEALETSIVAEVDAASSEPLVYHNRTWHRLHDGSRLD